MKMHPYLFFGLGSRIWTTYRIENGVAYSETWFGRKASIPLSGAKFEASGSIFPFGHLTIRSGGESLELRRVSGKKQVLAALDRSRLGQSPEPASPQTNDARTPPTNVKFGDEVILLQSLPFFFNFPFYEFTGTIEWFSRIGWEEGQWLPAGTPLKMLSIPQHPNGCALCTIGIHRRLTFSVNTPTSGIVLYAGNAVVNSESHDNDPLMSKMLVLLLPKNTQLSGHRDSTFDQFLDSVKQHRGILFNNKELSNRFGARRADIYSDRRIDEVLNSINSRKFRQYKVANLPEYAEDYTMKLNSVRAKYPGNFD